MKEINVKATDEDTVTSMTDDEHVTILSKREFEDFVKQLSSRETDPEVLKARKRLMALKPVWEN